MTAKTWTVNAIKDANRAAGFHWFDPDTMRTFGTKVLPTVYQGPGGVYFVTKDDQFRPELPKRYTVRSFDPETGGVGTVGELNAYADRDEAASQAKRRAIGRQPSLLVEPEAGGIPYEMRGLKTTDEAFRPVSILEQFLADLHKHGRPDATEADALELVKLAGRHHRAAERECNEGGDHTTRVESQIEPLGLRVGAAGFRFSGDPRGCTVKIVFADGFTNDFGGEGYCVPTSTRNDE